MRCNICQHTHFNFYGRELNVDVSTFDSDDSRAVSDIATIGFKATFVQCCQCNGTIWGIDCGWYPFLDYEKAKWRNRNSKPAPASNEKLDLLKGLSIDDLQALLALRNSK
jgi:hypothetical protein